MASSGDVSPDVKKFSNASMAHDGHYQRMEVRLEIWWRLEVRALADDHWLSSICRSADIKANRATHVTIRRSEQKESKVARVIFKKLR